MSELWDWIKHWKAGGCTASIPTGWRGGRHWCGQSRAEHGPEHVCGQTFCHATWPAR